MTVTEVFRKLKQTVPPTDLFAVGLAALSLLPTRDFSHVTVKVSTAIFSLTTVMDPVNEPIIRPVESNIKVLTFTAPVCETLVKFEVIKLKDSVYMWIGEKRARIFDDLSLAIMSRSAGMPVCTKIMGQQTNLTSNNIAMKLSKRLNKPVYVSFNLTEDRMTVSVVNDRIAEEIRRNPELF